jgi:hypothetical protein
MTLPDPWATTSNPMAAGSQIKRSNSIPLDMHEIDGENPLVRANSMGRTTPRGRLQTSGMSIRCYSVNTLFMFCLAVILLSWGSTCGYRQTVWSAAFHGCHQTQFVQEAVQTPTQIHTTSEAAPASSGLQKHRHTLHERGKPLDSSNLENQQ